MKNPFHHKNRQSVVDMFRPPPGYRLDLAVGTTYSVDFVTLTSVILAFADAESDKENGPSIPEQLFAFTRFSDRLKLFVNRGCILLSGVRESSRICAIYDSVIEEVSLPEGSFHPKLWFLSYQPKHTPDNAGAKPIHRMLVGSRNLTLSNSWELGVKLDGQSTIGKRRDIVGDVLSRYLSSIQQFTGCQSSVLDTAIATLPSIEFSSPAGITECSLAIQWPGEIELVSSLPATGKEAVIVSPFLGKTFVERVTKDFEKVTLISTRREIELKLDENIVTSLQPNLFYVNDDASAEVTTQLSLHAKLYFFETSDSQQMLVGSANASRNAWQGINSEAMLSFPLGIKKSSFLEDFVHKSKSELHPWIERYLPDDWKNREPETEAEEIDNRLSEAQEILSRFAFELVYDAGDSQLWLKALDKRQKGSLDDLFGREVEIGAVPISMLQPSNERQWTEHPLGCAFADGITYEATVGRLTQFVCFRIRHTASQASRMVVLKCSKDNFADYMAERNKELLRNELSAKQFALLLSSLLFDKANLAGKRMREIVNRKKHGSSSGAGSYFDVLIEDVMLACTEDETRIEDISRLLETFEGTDPDGNEFVDADFRTFWAEFQRAFETGRRGN
jgi:hypothetical protein